MHRTLAMALCSLCMFTACALGGGDSKSPTDDLVFEQQGDMFVPHHANGHTFYVNPARRPQTVYLNFDGAVIHKGDWAQNNAQTNTSFIPGTDTVYMPAFNSSWWPGDRDAVIETIADGVREDFANFDVTVTTTRPASGDYTMAIMGGSPSDAAVTGAAGLSPVDANNWNSSDVVFVFTDEFRNYDPRHVAWATSHELGHSYGLNHISPMTDIMCPVINFNPLAWGEGPYPDNSGYQRDLDVLEGVLRDLTAPPRPCGGLAPGDFLDPGELATSCDGRFTLIMQTDGNLVLYQGSHALWASNTYGSQGQRAIMQNDGNFVLYDPNRPLWASNTAGRAGARLALQNDGNLVVYTSSNQAVWASGTCCH